MRDIQKKENNIFVYPSNYEDTYNGINLRDYFAAKAMQAMVSRDNPSSGFSENDAQQIYYIADTMLKHREL